MGQQKSGALLTISPLKKHLIWLQTIKHMAAAFNTTNTQYASGSDKNQKKYFSSSDIIGLSSFNNIILIHISIHFQILLVHLLYMRLRASKSGRDWEEVNYHTALKMWFCSGNFLAPSRRRQNEKKHHQDWHEAPDKQKNSCLQAPNSPSVVKVCSVLYKKFYNIFRR